MGEEIEKLRSKAKMIGLDVDVLINEIADVVGQRVQVDAKALAEEIAASMPQATVDVQAIVDQLRDSLPEGGGPALDVVEVKTALETKIWEKVEAEFTSLAGDLKTKLEAIRAETREGVDAAVESKLMAALQTYRNEVAAAAKNGQGNGQQPAGAGAGGDRWGMALEVLDRFLERQDPLANIENLSNIYARLGNIFGGGPDPTTLYRGNQQAFLEGLKVGAKAKGGAAPASPFSSAGPGGRSTTRPRPSSRIDRVIDSL